MGTEKRFKAANGFAFLSEDEKADKQRRGIGRYNYMPATFQPRGKGTASEKREAWF